MTDINVETTAYQVEKRSWYLGTADDPGFIDNGTLDVSAFTPATHYPNGFIPSGVVLGKITATPGMYGPYDDTATDGRQVAAGYLFSATKVPNPADTTKDVGCAVLQAFATVRESKLPIANGAAGRGYIDAAAKTDLVRIHHV